MSMGTSAGSPPVDYNEGPVQLPPWSRRRWVAYIAFLLAVTGLAAVPLVSQLVDDDVAVSDDPGAVPTTMPPVASTAPPTTAVTVEDTIRARYLEFWRVHDEYGRATGPFDPAEFKARFEPVATGGEYDYLFNTFQLLRARGHAFRGGVPVEQELAPQVALEALDRAVVRDCIADSGEVYEVATGRVVEPPTEGREVYETVMVLGPDDLWRVASVGGSREPCAL